MPYCAAIWRAFCSSVSRQVVLEREGCCLEACFPEACFLEACLPEACGFAVVFRFVLIPLFLFSGTFFPVTQLPAWIRPVAYLTPQWHGVVLCRGISLGTLTAGGALGHVGYLAAVAAAGLLAGRRTYRRRLHA